MGPWKPSPSAILVDASAVRYLPALAGVVTFAPDLAPSPDPIPAADPEPVPELPSRQRRRSSLSAWLRRIQFPGRSRRARRAAMAQARTNAKGDR